MYILYSSANFHKLVEKLPLQPVKLNDIKQCCTDKLRVSHKAFTFQELLPSENMVLV